MSSLDRMLLRLSACAALRGATLAGENVFDSRIEAVDLSQEDNLAAAIAVYTEQDDGDAVSSANGGPPFFSTVDLVLEITMQVAATGADGNLLTNPDGSFQIGTPVTDDQLEASVDLLEAQAELALFRSPAELPSLFRRVARIVHRKNSVRFTDPTAGTKLATRYVTFNVQIEDQEVAAAYDATLTGLNRLPPLFASVAAQWPEGPEKTKALQAASALVTTIPTPFHGVDISATPGTPGDRPAPAKANVDLPQ